MGFPLRYFLKPIHRCYKTWPAYHSSHCIPINTPFNPRLQWFANIDQYIPINYSISQQNITIKNRQKKHVSWLDPRIVDGWVPQFQSYETTKKIRPNPLVLAQFPSGDREVQQMQTVRS